MLNRRDLLHSAAAFALSPSLLRAEEEGTPGINERIEKMIRIAEGDDFHATTEKQLVDNPDGAVIHWRWVHFRPDIPNDLFPIAEDTNRQLYYLMREVQQYPELGFDHLLHEGYFPERIHQQLSEMQRIHRDSVAYLLDRNIHDPFVARRMGDMTLMKKFVPMSDVVGNHVREYSTTPLARLGAGYVINWMKDVKILPMENKELDIGAEEAEKQRDPKQRDKWIQWLRNQHAINLTRRMKQKIKHVFLGCNHNLSFAIKDSNALYDRRFSHLRITVPGVRAFEEWLQKRGLTS